METIMPFLPTLGKWLIGCYFIFFGIWNIYHWKPITDVMLEDRIPSPVLLFSIGVSLQTLLGMMILGDIYIKVTAMLLMLFTVLSSFLFHPFWRFSGEKRKLHLTKFVENFTLTLGALFLLMI